MTQRFRFTHRQLFFILLKPFLIMLVLSDITLTYSKDYTNVMLYGTDQPNNNFDYLFLDFLRVNTSSTGMF